MKQDFKLPLVNAHTHAAMIAFRGLAEDVSLDEWLNKYIFPMEKEKVNPKFVYEQTKIAIKEMQKNGIKAFNDMYFFEDEVAKAAEEMKVRVVIGEGILDFPTPSAKTPEEALEITEKLLEKYKNNPFVSVAVAPHSIYTVSPEILIKAKKLAQKYNAIYHIHLSETKKEFDDCLKKNKLTPVGFLEKLRLLDEKTILAHCLWVTDEDIEILSNKKVNVVHCPLSNLKLGSGIAPISKMIEAGINVALGTDGAASSNRLDIWEAGKIAALLQKGINQNPTKIPAKEVIKMMTINGMKALEIKEISNKSIFEIEEELSRDESYNFLYELNVEDLNFS
jgi:5-methylthioadenosine/S-adenosylhomocysteine deaminase